MINPKRNTRAFTLIELLIVIAIILILIAIALPNFLEAQTRAKVTNAQAEMRSLGTAIEAYMTDYRHYPLDGDDFEMFDPSLWAVSERLKTVTTPIAYITEIPQDPFHQTRVAFGGGADQLLFPEDPPYPYSYNTPRTFAGDPSRGLKPNGGKPFSFGLTSFGPSLEFDSVTAQGALHYAPTNGSKSSGDILRLVGSDHPLAP